MSNDFWSTLNKKKKEELLKSTQTKQSSTTREETKSSDFWSVLNEDKKKELLSSATTNDAPMRTFMSDDDDIAPVVSSSSERASFFTKGGLSDGYDKWDVSKTVAGTVGDVLLTAAQGVGNMAEGLVDLGAYGVAGVSNILGADDFAKKAKDFAKKNHVDEVVEENQDLMGLNDYSVLGKYPRMVGNGVGQILGTVATAGLGKLGSLGKIGSTILTSGVIGASGMGSGMSEAYSMGATDDKATAYGASVGAIEVISELLFGGLGKGFNSLGLSKGLTSIDDVVAKKLSNTAAKFITSEAGQKVVGNALEYTVKSGAEGLEEVISGFGSAIAKDAYLMNEEDEKAFLEILEDENLLEQFVIGSIVSGFAQGGDVINATKNGRDFVSGLSKNEQTVVDKVYEQRLAEESENRTLTNRDKNNLYDRIVNEMKRGYVTTDEIESILGGETYKGYKDLTDKKTSLEERKTAIEEEIKSLIKTPETQYSLREEAKGIDDFLANPGIDEAKNKLFNEVNKLTAKDTYLRESYNDLLRKEQAIDIDENQYKGTKFEDAAKKTIENARKAGANNSNRVRDFVNFSAKYSSVSGTVVDFTDKVQINKMLEDQIKSQISELQTSTVTEDKKKLAELQKMLKQVQEGKIHVNGIKTKDGVAINLESPNYLNTILGHEVTHFLEGKNGYEALQKAIFKHAQNKGDYEGRRKALEALYKNIDGTTVDYELTADLVGDYLFTDYDFIKNLSTENRNVFQQIYDQVKYMFKLATAGSKEARELEKVMHQFEKVLRESTQEGEKVDGKTQFSIKATEDGTKYVKLDGNIFLKEDGTEMSPTEAYNALVGKKITLEDGDVITFIKKLPDRNVYKELFKKLPGYEEGIDVKAISESINKNIVEVITASEAQTRNEAQRHPHIGIKDFDQREVFIADDSDAYRLELCIANLTDGTKIAYVKRYIERASQEISEKIKKAETAEQIRLNQPSVDAEGIETNDTTSTNDIIAQFPENVNTQF